MSEPKYPGIVVSLVLAAVIGLSGWAWGSVTARVDKTLDVLNLSNQRITKTETEIAALKETLDRIDRKLDKALDRK